MRAVPRAPVLAAIALASLPAARAAHADRSDAMTAHAVAADDGGQIYQRLCQGCHMADARGAQGAARYPALAGNRKLAASGYPVYVVLNGYGGMPWLADKLSDAQVAAVVNYVRTHFGNHYTDPVSAADVALQRPLPAAIHEDID